jgi:hypothetical protein
MQTAAARAVAAAVAKEGEARPRCLPPAIAGHPREWLTSARAG